MTWVIDPVFVNDEGPNQTAKLQKRMPISTIACQTRCFDRYHRTDTALADPGKKLLEAGSRNTGTRTAEIIVDNFNISPAELTGALNKRILAPFAFKVVCNLTLRDTRP